MIVRACGFRRAGGRVCFGSVECETDAAYRRTGGILRRSPVFQEADGNSAARAAQLSPHGSTWS